MRGLAGKNVIVTGAASGIGRACAARLLEEGASVMGADLASGPGRPGDAVGPGRVGLHRRSTSPTRPPSCTSWTRRPAPSDASTVS